MRTIFLIAFLCISSLSVSAIDFQQKTKEISCYTVTARSLIVRYSPESNGTIVGSYISGDKVCGNREINNWFMTKKGWVSKNYLTLIEENTDILVSEESSIVATNRTVLEVEQESPQNIIEEIQPKDEVPLQEMKVEEKTTIKKEIVVEDPLRVEEKPIETKKTQEIIEKKEIAQLETKIQEKTSKKIEEKKPVKISKQEKESIIITKTGVVLQKLKPKKEEFIDINPRIEIDKKLFMTPPPKEQIVVDTTTKVYEVTEKKEEKKEEINILKDIVFSKDGNLKESFDKEMIFNEYTLNVKNSFSRGSLGVIKNLENSKANIGALRGDILAIKNNGLYGFLPFKNYGILCSATNSVLYLVGKKEIKSAYDLRGLTISTGLVNNIAQIYLNDIAKIRGFALDINFKGYNLEDSKKALKENNIDAFFMFAGEDEVPELLKEGFIINSIPNDMLQKLLKRKELKAYEYIVGDELIKTVMAPNYIIAPLTTLDVEISKKILAVINQFQCHKRIQNIDPFYGAIHPTVKDAIEALTNKENAQEAITYSFKSSKSVNGGVKYIYQLENNSNVDSNVSFSYYNTKLFDKTPIKPRHLLDFNPKNAITIKPKEKKFVTIFYRNPYAIRVKKTEIGVVLIEQKTKEEISIPLTIGDIDE